MRPRGSQPGLSRASRWSTQIFVGPPDPISNLRPVIYDATPTGSSTKTVSATHPYSLSEFSMPHKSAALRQNNALSRYAEKLMTRLEAAQLHARLQSMWLDQYNQRFWTDNNVRFSRALQEYESTISPNTPASLEQVSPFYREWLATNAERLRHYNRTLWVATYKVIGAQVWYRCVLGYTRVVAWLAGMRE